MRTPHNRGLARSETGQSAARSETGPSAKLIAGKHYPWLAAAMMVHPADADLIRMDTIAVQEMYVDYHGKAAHAAAAPQEGRNALDAAVLGYVNVTTRLPGAGVEAAAWLNGVQAGAYRIGAWHRNRARGPAEPNGA